jgi:hypothetical protein
MRRLFIVLFMVAAVACGDDDNESRNSNGDGPTSPSSPVKLAHVEIRVFGNIGPANSVVIIKHSNSADGLAIVNAIVPYIFSFDTDRDSLFLYVDAQSSFGTTTVSFIQVQIFVNGILFREASSQGFQLFAQAQGTWRR